MQGRNAFSTVVIWWHFEQKPKYTRTGQQNCQVGVDPCNRRGFGINVKNVHALAGDIGGLGWSAAATRDALCVEMPCTPEKRNAIEDFNIRLCNGNEELAPVLRGSIGFSSLACSHTNYLLRAILAACPSNHPKLSHGGKLCKEQIARTDPAFGNALSNGLTWTVLKDEVRERWPSALPLLSRAINATGHIQRQEDEMQAMYLLWSLAAQQWDNVRWDQIRLNVAQANTAHSEDLTDMIIFITECSGGRKGFYMHELERFHRSHVNSALRQCRGSFFHRWPSLSCLSAFLSLP